MWSLMNLDDIFGSRGPASLNRRAMLKRAACGFGYLAFAGLCAESTAPSAAPGPLAPKAPHHPARAKRVIFLFMHGGPSQTDTFDYKPRLQRETGQPCPFNLPGAFDGDEKYKNKKAPPLLGSPWNFRQHGQSGLWVSDLLPEIAACADELCVIRSLHTEGQAHGEATLRMHTGASNLVRPSVGSWVTYGLGSENESLPGFVTISPPRAHGGVQNYSSAFLPAAYQGTPVGSADVPIAQAEIPFLKNLDLSSRQQRRQLDLIQRLNRGHLARAQRDPNIEGLIESYELAFRMQSEAPDLMQLDAESPATKALYGIGEKETDDFGRQCLLARRFAEAGVRYVQVSTGYKWDQHKDLVDGHNKIARATDRPIAGLLKDLRGRGLLDDTLVLWGAEFGRTPFAEGENGRDHNPQGFSVWLAGGGVRGGMVHGETDDYGHRAVTDKVHVHDLHATLLHLLGLDHERLTYRYSGRDFRLTDVQGEVVEAILA
jgi:hypothetical protein